MTTEYKVSVHYDEGTVLTIEADNASEACEKANKILLDEASVSTQVSMHLTHTIETTW